jgi:hypothetical protein
VLLLRQRIALFEPAALALLLVWSSAPTVAAEPPLVGADYCPWYGTFAGGHPWRETLRKRLTPAEPPALGEYSSRDSATIAAHIDQSHRGNISFWAISWWGPGSADDTTTHDYIFAHSRASELKYAIHYESTGRLGSPDKPNFANLSPDFDYLAHHYFNNSNYLKIDDRPVVFIYLTRAYFNMPAARNAVTELRRRLKGKQGVEPYLIGDDVFPHQTNPARAVLWDAITDFDFYGTALQTKGTMSAGVKALADEFKFAKEIAAKAHVAFVPTISPGFNDSAVRPGHHAAARYLSDAPGNVESSLFTAELNEAAIPNLDPAANNMLMISTFNEWHEDTQIEPTIVVAPTDDDDSGQAKFTQGKSYIGYGDLYLDLLREATSSKAPASTTSPPSK